MTATVLASSMPVNNERQHQVTGPQMIKSQIQPQVSGKAAVYKKMQLVMSDVGHIPKSGWNAHHKYNFTRAEDICRRLQKVMSRHGLIIIPSMGEMTRDGRNTTVKWEMTIADTDSGAEIVMTWYSEAMDTQDKGLNKCATAAVKYMLLKLFLIPDENEPDEDEEGPIVEKAKGMIESAKSEKELKEIGKSLTGKIPNNARDAVKTVYRSKTEKLKAELAEAKHQPNPTS